MNEITNENYLQKLFIDEAKPALERHGYGGRIVPSYGTIDFYDENIIEINEQAPEEYQLDLASVSCPSATSIGRRAFSSCYNLTQVDLPSATSIGEDAFASCYNLTKVDLPSATSIGEYAFHSCYNLTQVDLPSATSIGDYAFSICHNLTKVDLPSATSIGYSAFASCYNLAKVDLPSATSIGDYAFSICHNLTRVILRTTDTVCIANPSAFSGTQIERGNGFIYIPASMYDAYASVYGDFMVIFRKIEDYPEICG